MNLYHINMLNIDIIYLNVHILFTYSIDIIYIYVYHINNTYISIKKTHTNKYIYMCVWVDSHISLKETS